MTVWLTVLVLDALGLLLLWNGDRSNDEVQFALGGVIVFSVTALFLFRLVANALTRRHSGTVPPTRANMQPFVSSPHRVLSDILLLAWLDGGGGRRAGGEGSGEDVAAADFDLGDADD